MCLECDDAVKVIARAATEAIEVTILIEDHANHEKVEKKVDLIGIETRDLPDVKTATAEIFDPIAAPMEIAEDPLDEIMLLVAKVALRHEDVQTDLLGARDTKPIEHLKLLQN
jgi:putative N-acetylmannosamine-6-phosphate epimerase